VARVVSCGPEEQVLVTTGLSNDREMQVPSGPAEGQMVVLV